jgi:16S rRNA (uracil1498-N3)-methyltransferase
MPTVSYRQMLAEAGKAQLSLFCYEGEGTEPLGALIYGSEKEIAVVVGSEGGFTPEEVTAAKDAGLRLCGLGHRILRCETAPTFVLSCLSLARELTP